MQRVEGPKGTHVYFCFSALGLLRSELAKRVSRRARQRGPLHEIVQNQPSDVSIASLSL